MTQKTLTRLGPSHNTWVDDGRAMSYEDLWSGSLTEVDRLERIGLFPGVLDDVAYYLHETACIEVKKRGEVHPRWWQSTSRNGGYLMTQLVKLANIGAWQVARALQDADADRLATGWNEAMVGIGQDLDCSVEKQPGREGHDRLWDRHCKKVAKEGLAIINKERKTLDKEGDKVRVPHTFRGGHRYVTVDVLFQVMARKNPTARVVHLDLDSQVMCHKHMPTPVLSEELLEAMAR